MRKAKIQTMVTKQMSVTIYLTDVKKKKKHCKLFYANTFENLKTQEKQQSKNTKAD